MQENNPVNAGQWDQDSAVNQMTDSSLVQITASNQEIERRISAFMELKRIEINQQNIRDYCGMLSSETESDGCARTTAIFVPHSGGRANYKVSRVINQHGPQTQQNQTNPPLPSASDDSGSSAVETRLCTVEAHLGLNNPTVRADIHSRLRRMEDRILRLEGASPEYFSYMNFPLPSKSSDQQQKCDEPQTSSDLSVTEIDGKIQQLRAILKMKKDSLQMKYT